MKTIIERLVNISPGSFRLFLALVVMVYHSVGFLTIGHAAVYIFFILSGYWILKMYNEKYIKFGSPYLTYIKSRFFRIYPIYWTVLLLTLLLYVFFDGLPGNVLCCVQDDSLLNNLLSNFFLIFRNIRKDYLYIGTAWSLDVELQFYILAPILIYIYRSNVVFSIFFIVLTLLILDGFIINSFIIKYNTLFVYLPYFLIGGSIYFYEYKSNLILAKFSIYLIFIILAIHYIVPYLRMELLLNRNAEFFVFNTEYREGLNVIITLISVPFIAYNIRRPLNPKLPEGIMSSMSYVLYLLHWPLFQIYAFKVRDVNFNTKFIYLFIFYIVTIILSYLISYYIDRYFEDKRKNWLIKVPKR